MREERKGKGGRHALVAVNLAGEKVSSPMTFYVASSFISREQAELNLREVASRSYQQVREEGKLSGRSS